MIQKITFEEFIQKETQIHGEKIFRTNSNIQRLTERNNLTESISEKERLNNLIELQMNYLFKLENEDILTPATERYNKHLELCDLYLKK